MGTCHATGRIEPLFADDIVYMASRSSSLHLIRLAGLRAGEADLSLRKLGFGLQRVESFDFIVDPGRFAAAGFRPALPAAWTLAGRRGLQKRDERL